MAKLERHLNANLDNVLNAIHTGIMNGSASASFEDGSYYSGNGFRCAVNVYERYSMIGGNRVSLSVTVVGTDNDTFVSAITSGGSQAVFLKINTFGEQAFLDCVKDILSQFN